VHNNCAALRSIRNTFIPLIASACILQSCLPAGFLPISEENKDSSGRFDGQWEAVGISTATTQRVGIWRLTCSDKKDKTYGPIRVSDGRASTTIGGREGTGFIDSTGSFRLEVPVAVEARAAGNSDSTLNNGAVTIILNGSLADQTGLLTFGVADFANAGCATSVAYNKI